MNSPIPCKIPILFSTVKLRTNFPKSSINSKLGFFVLFLGYTFKFFPITEGFRYATLFKKRLYHRCCKICKISMNTFSYRTHLVAASASNKEIFGFLNVALAGLLNFSQFKKKMKNFFFEYKSRLHFQISPNSLKS